MRQFSRFYSELKRRNVFRAGAAYVVIAWLVVQVADILFDAFDTPGWLFRTLIVALVVGFPVALLLSWIYEITVEGVKRTEEVLPNESITDITGRKLNFFVIGLLLVAVALFSVERFIWPQFGDTRSQTEDVPSLAVLPFGFQSDQIAPFFQTLSSELSRQLQDSGGLRLASMDAIEAIPSGSTLPEISSRLGVRFILSGFLEFQKDFLTLSVSIFDAKTSHQLMSESFKNAQLQETLATVSEAVLSSVGVNRSARSTSSTDARAYELYLRARQHAASTFLSDEAKSLYRQAIGIDPRFAPAHAGLCALLVDQYGWTANTRDFENAERSCIRGWTIDEESKEVQLSLAGLYEQSGQLEKARELLSKILESDPYNYSAQVALAATLHEENPDLAETQLRRLIRQNPGSPSAYMSLQYLYWKQGRYDEAIEQQRWAVKLLPNDEGAKLRLSADLMMAGEFDEAKDLLMELLEGESEKTGSIQNNLGFVLFFEGNYKEAARLFELGVEREPEDSNNLRNLGDAIWHLEGNQAAVPIFRQAVDLAKTQLMINPKDAYSLSSMMVSFGSLDDVEGFVSAKDELLLLQPDNPQTHYDIAVAASRLGQLALARQHAQRALEMGFPIKLLMADPDILASGYSSE